MQSSSDGGRLFLPAGLDLCVAMVLCFKLLPDDQHLPSIPDQKLRSRVFRRNPPQPLFPNVEILSGLLHGQSVPLVDGDFFTFHNFKPPVLSVSTGNRTGKGEISTFSMKKSHGRKHITLPTMADFISALRRKLPLAHKPGSFETCKS